MTDEELRQKRREAGKAGRPASGPVRLGAWSAVMVIMGRHFQGCTFIGCELVYDGWPV
jgi:hypothetical protein